MCTRIKPAVHQQQAKPTGHGRKSNDPLARLRRLGKRRDWGLALVVAGGLGCSSPGGCRAQWMSTLEGVAAMGRGPLVGLVAGLLQSTQWAVAIAPATFVAHFRTG